MMAAATPRRAVLRAVGRAGARAGALVAIATLCACAPIEHLCRDPSPVIGAASELEPAACRTFVVRAYVPWNRSGVQLRTGDTYRLSAAAPDAPWQDWYVAASPEQGWSGEWKSFGRLLRFGARTPSADMYALVCSVGQRQADAAAIERDVQRRADADGELFCFANDWSPSYDNNQGCVKVTVCRSPP